MELPAALPDKAASSPSCATASGAEAETIPVAVETIPVAAETSPPAVETIPVAAETSPEVADAIPEVVETILGEPFPLRGGGHPRYVGAGRTDYHLGLLPRAAMLTRLRIAHFKCFTEMVIPLDSPVVLVGKNGAGKTAALQALALWELGVRTFHARRAAQREHGAAAAGAEIPAGRALGVALRRRDLTQIPLPGASHLWHRTEVRAGRPGPDRRVQPLRIELVVDGQRGAEPWSCGLELDYGSDDTLMCRPLRLPGFAAAKVKGARFQAVSAPAAAVRVAYLPPMSGVSVSEPKWELGRVNVLLGEGQTAQVIRNLCLHLHTQKPDRGLFQRLCQRMQELFGVRLQNPEFIAERGEIVMKYREPDGTRLDLSAAGKGMLQTMLLLCHLYMNPGAVLLLDEPDAHLEPLRQRQILRTVLAAAAEQDSQVIAASHSEIVMSELSGRGSVVLLDAAAGTAQTLAAVPGSFSTGADAGGAAEQRTLAAVRSQARPAGLPMPGAAREAAWAEHLQARQTGWVLYVPEPLDLAILYALAQCLKHPALQALEQPLCHYIGEGPEAAARARRHFDALRALHPAVRGAAFYNHGPRGTAAAPAAAREAGQADPQLYQHSWRRGDLDGYYALDEVLLAYARGERGIAGEAPGAADAAAGRSARRQLQLVSMLSPEQRRREQAMRTAVAEIDAALRTLGRVDRQGEPSRTRADFLRPLFQRVAAIHGPDAVLRESEYPALVRLLPPQRIDPEIEQQLDAVARCFQLAEAGAPPVPVLTASSLPEPARTTASISQPALAAGAPPVPVLIAAASPERAAAASPLPAPTADSPTPSATTKFLTQAPLTVAPCEEVSL